MIGVRKIIHGGNRTLATEEGISEENRLIELGEGNVTTEKTDNFKVYPVGTLKLSIAVEED